MEFYKGTTIKWTGLELGTCFQKEFNVNDKDLRFKVKSSDGNDFCPEFLTISLKNAYNQDFQFKSGKMNDWVDSSKGGHHRTATKIFTGTYIFSCQA